MSEGQNLMSGRVALVLGALTAVTGLALILLFAFAPDLRKTESSGADAYSVSAIGFAGLAKLLSYSGIATRIEQGDPFSTTPSLTILTPSAATSVDDLRALTSSRPVLVILPKWIAFPMQDKPQWVRKFSALNPRVAQRTTEPLAEIPIPVQRFPGNTHALAILKGAAAPKGFPDSLGVVDVENLQVIMGGATLLMAGRYGPVLAESPSRGIFILSDPDLMNNQGLASEARAAAALAIVKALRKGNGPVAFDVTLDGLGRSPEIWSRLFEPPFLGASLAAFLVAFLIALHAVSRFGAPAVAARVFANGKKALADNSAALIRIMGREPGMAARYVAEARNQVVAALDIRRASPQEQARLLARLEAGAGVTSYSDLAREAGNARSGGDLLRVARKTYAWKRGIVSGD
jgi:hypothetical protein